MQPGGYLAVGVVQASQRGDLLLTWAELPPAIQISFSVIALGNGKGQQLGSDFLLWALLTFGQVFEGLNQLALESVYAPVEGSQAKGIEQAPPDMCQAPARGRLVGHIEIIPEH